MLFNAGNLITLGIVFLLLVFFRLLDRNNRSLGKLRDYANQCKKEISAFVEDKAAVIKNYGITLDVERQSAMELMRRIQTLSREELAQKVQALAQIDDRIRDYDASLEELVQMTGRVQENLNRIRDESSFVEGVGKRLGDVKEKVENIDREIGSIGKKLETIERHFEEENSEALEKAVAETLLAARSSIAGFEASAGAIESKIEAQRETADRLEREREEKLQRNEERLDELFLQALDRAGSRADKAEEAALSKLRDQAQERLNIIKTHFEEKIKTVQETVKTKLGEIQEQIKSNREEWKAETSAIEARQKAYSADWKKEVHDLNALVKEQQDNWSRDMQELGSVAKRQHDALDEDIKNFDLRARQRQDGWNKDIQEFTSLARQQAENLNEAIRKQNEELAGALKIHREEWEAAARSTGESVIAETREAVNEKADEIKEQINASREQWQAEAEAIESRRTAVDQQAENLSAAIRKQNEELTGSLEDYRKEWEAAARDTGQGIIAAARETADEKADEIKEQVNSVRKEWQAEAEAIESRRVAIDQQAENLSAAIRKQNEEFAGSLKNHREKWEAAARDTGESVIAAARETVDKNLNEIREQVNSSREEWQAEAEAIESRRIAINQQTANLSADIQKQGEEFAESLKDQRAKWEAVSRETGQKVISAAQEIIKEKLDEIQEQAAAVDARQKAHSADWKKEIRELDAFAQRQKQEIISAAQDRLDEYRQAQEEQFRQLSGIANDTARMEAELRLSMQDAMNRVNNDFALFGKEIRGGWENASGEFNGKIQDLRDELAGIDRELAGIKEKAFENVSQKLKVFEDDFLADLSRRSAGIDQQLSAWHEALDKRLELIAEGSETQRQKTEARMTEEIRKGITVQGEKLVSELERLKTETAAFEEGIREEMLGVDESRKSFSEQLERDLEEVKSAAENELTGKISQYNLSVAATLRQSQRDLEEQIKGAVSDAREQIDGMEASSSGFRKSIEEWQTQYNIRMRELDDSMEEARRRGREFSSENDERIAASRSSLEDMRREITAQAKLFDRTDALKAELNRHVEDMSGNIDRLLQFKNEIAHFENQFIQIKRLEDDVNAKMTRFLSEKRRIEIMESDFNRLIQTSQSVEEKLTQVSNSDDTLQTMQVQIRRLEDAIKETEEKYQRVERKNKTLQETNDGIDRNFKALQEDEQSIKRLESSISALKANMEDIKDSVETLSAENEKAQDAAGKLSSLDETVKWLEKRITEMNIARESLARLATELQNLDKDAQDQLNLTRSLLNREEGKLAGRGGKAAEEGAPPPRDRENIIRLKRQGWSIDEIARSMKISKGEVELILELGPKDI
ncbi:MAG: hypothetical protein LBG95_09190 [Treponema sp.]|jgi:chromosome segregation ATPase|nr:hypothetical protein [Treponema sp.]